MAGVQIDGVNNKIDFDDDLDTSISANVDDTLQVEVGGVSVATMTASTVVFNEASADVDFRVESNGKTHMLFVDGGNDHVNIGTSSDLGGVLNVAGNMNVTGSPFTLTNTTNNNNIDIKTTGSGSVVHAVKIHSSGLFEAKQGAIFNEDSNDVDFRVESNGDTHALFVDAGNNRVGIGTSSPDYTLTVRSMGSPSNDSIINIVGEATDSNCGIQFTNSAGTLKGRFLYDTDDNTLATVVNTSEVSRYMSGGQFLINRTSSNQNDHDNGKLERVGVTETSAARNSLYLSNTSGSFGSYLQRNDATRAANSAYGFFIGSSGDEGDNEIRMMGDGSINSDGSNNLGSGADYAEYFEWKDGNSSSEDRRGYSVVLDGNKIVKATDSDDASKIIGVISGNPAVVGDSAWNKWNQKHLKDNFNTYIWEDYTQTEWTDADGNFISHQTDLIPDGVTAPDDAVVVSKEEDGTTNLQRRKVNPSWDSTATYVPRSDRKEWDTVGLMGKLRIKKGQPTGTNWIKMRDISDTVEEWLVR